MYPHGRSLVKKMAGKPFALIGVNSDQEIEKVKKLIEDGTVTWRSFRNQTGNGTISEEWEVQGWPSIFLLDAEGIIRYINPHMEKTPGVDLDSAIAALMKELDE